MLLPLVLWNSVWYIQSKPLQAFCVTWRMAVYGSKCQRWPLYCLLPQSECKCGEPSFVCLADSSNPRPVPGWRVFLPQMSINLVHFASASVFLGNGLVIYYNLWNYILLFYSLWTPEEQYLSFSLFLADNTDQQHLEILVYYLKWAETAFCFKACLAVDQFN